jgi:hypothetical protein
MSVATKIRINALIEGFPHKPAKILGLPAFETLKELKQALEANVHPTKCCDQVIKLQQPNRTQWVETYRESPQFDIKEWTN